MLSNRIRVGRFTSMYGLKLVVVRIGNQVQFFTDGGNNVGISAGTTSGEKVDLWARPTDFAAVLPYAGGRIALNTNGSLWTSVDIPANFVHGTGVGYSVNDY
jgi:hypothetical protein